MLASCILANPARGGRCHWLDTLKSVGSRIPKWRAGECAEQWQGVVYCPSPDRANFALQGLLEVINHLCAGRAPSVLIYTSFMWCLSLCPEEKG